MKLLNLELENFKGIRKFELSVAGLDAAVYGDNATGKTTLFDAMLWLLFGKDSLNRSDFEIKTIDAAGKVIPMLDHRVSGDFILSDGRTVNLTRVYKEKYERKRGSATQEMTGHTTDFFIDGVPKLSKEYKSFVESIADEDIFKLITNPLYFNEQLTSDARRRLLLEICGDVSDEEVIASNPRLGELLNILNGRSLEEYKKIIAARKTAINKELDLIPARIDEINKGMADVSGFDSKALMVEVEFVSNKIAEAMERKTLAKNGDGILNTKAELIEVNNKISTIEFESAKELKKEVDAQKDLIRELEIKINSITSDMELASRKKEFIETEISDEEKHMKQHEETFRMINAEVFNDEIESICPTCKQSLPELEVEQIKEKAISAFNLKKSKKLEEISAGINRSKETIEKNEKLLRDTLLKLEDYEKELRAAKSLFDTSKRLLDEMSGKTPTYDSEYEELLSKRFELEFIISAGGTSTEDIVKSIDDEIADLQSVKQEIDVKISKIEAAKAQQQRIKELEENQRKLSEEFQGLEKEVFLIEEFIKAKVATLEDGINKHFKHARFKMFDVQVNGGIKEVCDTTFEGVPFRSMNNAARINVGIDIINALTKHYKVSAPVFIDNAEAVTEFEPCDSQVIKLFVSESDKTLRIGG